MRERTVLDLRVHGIAEVPMIGRYRYSEAQKGLDWHAHRAAMEICYLARGRQMYRVHGHDYVLRGGDVFVTFPGEVHSTGEAPEEKGILYWVQVMLPARGARFMEQSTAESAAIVRRLRRLPHRHFAGSPVLGRILDEVLASAAQPPSALNTLWMRARLLEFLMRVASLSEMNPSPAISTLIRELMQYIERNCHQTLPVPALAARAQLSVPRFQARFKQEVGIPPGEYVMRCKIAVAKRRLADPAEDVTAVAMDLNFSSPQYFATVFRRYVGCSPTAYRQGLGIDRASTRR
ncbi:MAG: AraC family transcriptional regulator [Verrucomicrobiae bacterium]|nr:AraC family transcriptional regulator [Verrucomicrobiae bacterium]MDW8342940.1 AraC family transcriptional regulator [Verrucomicrobiae bacterium]